MEKVFFENINNKKIFCYSTKPLEDQKKMIIMFHGFRGTNTGPARQFVDFQKQLNKEGYSILRVDLPNCGNSDGDYIDVSFDEWVNAIIYITKKYLNLDYKVALLGQSMGATAVTRATSNKELKNKIPCILLWVPGANADEFEGKSENIYEEAGQKYKGKFWIEAMNADFFKCLDEYKGGIHVVYGEHDKYVSEESRGKVIKMVKEKGESTMILQEQDHSPWNYDKAQEVYIEQIKKLNTYFGV